MTIRFMPQFVYIVRGIRLYLPDNILYVAQNAKGAIEFCALNYGRSMYYDIWIEKHEVI